jgi:hypothetical protein
MSIQAVGVRLDLDGPRPVAPPHSLLNTPGVVVERDSGRWLNGVNIVGYPDDTPSLWEPCAEGSFRVKDEGTGRPQAQFDPFVVYIPVTCSTFGSFDIRAQAEAVLEAVESMGVEEGLAAGIPGSSNPYLADGNLNVVGGAAVSPAAALSYLENEIGKTGRKGMIHATPAVIAAWQKIRLAGEDPLQTANGTPVVSGDGYIAVDPDDEAAPGTGEDYIYATGPVEVRLGPVVITELSESLDRSDNTVTFRAERYVLATWDTALQAGVLVDWAA